MFERSFGFRFHSGRALISDALLSPDFQVNRRFTKDSDNRRLTFL